MTDNVPLHCFVYSQQLNRDWLCKVAACANFVGESGEKLKTNFLESWNSEIRGEYPEAPDQYPEDTAVQDDQVLPNIKNKSSGPHQKI